MTMTKEYQNQWRINNRQKRVKYDTKSKQKKLSYFWSLKQKPYIDCGIRYHPVAMDFDHLPGQVKTAPNGFTKLGHQKMTEEIKKCDLVCANCHRIRIWRRSHEKMDK